MTSWEACLFLHEPSTFFSLWSGRQRREQDTYATTHEQDVGICWLRSPAQKKRSSASDAFAVFRLFGFHGEGKLTAPLKWLCDALAKNKQKTPHLYLMLTVYSQRLMLGAGAPLQSVEGGRKSSRPPLPLEMIQGTGSDLCKRVFGDYISLLGMRLCWSDHVPN